MTNTSNPIQAILWEIYTHEKSVNGIDHSKFESFLVSIVNGDQQAIISHLVISAIYGEKDEDCILVYILTKGKFIKIRVTKEGFTSSSAYLNQITGVNKAVVEGAKQRTSISVEYPQGSIGLTYPSDDTVTDSFFQTIDREVQSQRKTNG